MEKPDHPVVFGDQLLVKCVLRFLQYRSVTLSPGEGFANNR